MGFNLSIVGRYLQSAVFYTAYFLFSFVYILTTSLITLPVALFASRKTMLRLTRLFIRGYGTGTVWAGLPWIRLVFEDRSGVASGQSCLFVSNHQSIADIYLMAALSREVVFLSNRWPFKIPVLGFFAKLAGYMSVQSLPPDDLLPHVQELFRDGASIICFPEGTRTRTGQLGPFHTTAFRIAQQAGVPIVPVCISGTYHVMPPGSALLRPGTIRMHLLPAIDPQSCQDLNPHAFKRHMRDLMAQELATMEGGLACA